MQSFPFGRLCASRGVADTAAEYPAFDNFIWKSLRRYRLGDWGEMADADKRANDEAVVNGDLRIFAAYQYAGRMDWKIWIITEADRSATTVLFPDEY